MQYFTHIQKIILAGFALAVFAAPSVHAATLEISTVPAAPEAGKDFLIEIRTSTDGSPINAAEGSVTLPAGIAVQGVQTGGSVFSLWPVEPRFVRSTNTVEFTGGTPNALTNLSHALLFTVGARAQAAGTYAVSAGNARAFLSDGKGTPVQFAPVVKKITVGSKSSNEEVKTKDTTPPQFVVAELGNDTSLFNGNTYLTFFATDDKSGVKEYSVKEGLFGGYVPAEHYYVLKDQSLKKDLWVRATDFEGNQITKKIPATHPALPWSLIIGSILVAVIGLLLWMRFLKRRAY